jgi:hypothetical protein
LTAVASTTNASLQKAVITATREITSIDQIEPIFERLQQIKNVNAALATILAGEPDSRLFFSHDTLETFMINTYLDKQLAGDGSTV